MKECFSLGQSNYYRNPHQCASCFFHSKQQNAELYWFDLQMAYLRRVLVETVWDQEALPFHLVCSHPTVLESNKSVALNDTWEARQSNFIIIFECMWGLEERHTMFTFLKKRRWRDGEWRPIGQLRGRQPQVRVVTTDELWRIPCCLFHLISIQSCGKCA